MGRGEWPRFSLSHRRADPDGRLEGGKGASAQDGHEPQKPLDNRAQPAPGERQTDHHPDDTLDNTNATIHSPLSSITNFSLLINFRAYSVNKS